MSLEVNVPPVGESITEVTVARWAKEDGAQVAQDEILCELESDKATFELNAPEAGILRIVAQEQAVLEIGAVVCRLDPIDGQADPSNGAQGKDTKGKGKGKGPVTPEAPSHDQAERSADAAQGAGPYAGPVTTPVPEAFPGAEGGKGDSKSGQADQQGGQSSGNGGGGGVFEIHVPTVGESITEVAIAQWMVEDGAQVAQDEVLCEIESDKATFELTAERAGRLEIVAGRGTTLAIGDLVCRIHAQGQGGGNASQGQGEKSSDQDKGSQGNGSGEARAASSAGVAVTPVAANILAERGIDPGQVRGTGPQGRITKEDALKAQPGSQGDKGGQSAQSQKPQPPSPLPVKPPSGSQPSAPAGDRPERREPMSSLRRTVARRLVAVKNETAMLTTFNEVDMKPIMDLRSRYKDAFKEKHEVGLGFMSFFARAICVALSEFKAVNARIEGQEIVYNDYVDLSIAVSAPKGLMVPVIRNAQDMSFAAIEKEILRLAGRARDSKLSIEEMQGGTFTITNGGVFGSMLSTPIINAPQSAILGMHNIVERAVVQGGQIVVRPIMYVALSYDHRIIDGRESVSFLVRVKQLLEDPARLLLGV